VSFAARAYVALLHHPVLEKTGRVVTTAVTNLDVHDIARASKTYGLAGYFVVTPIAAQRKLVEEIIGHWTTGAGREHEGRRTDALELVRVAPALEDAVSAVRASCGGTAPALVATGARPRGGVVGYRPLRSEREADPGPTLLLFGTGWGLAESVFQAADRILAPISGAPARPGQGEYNHLSVRAAVAIVLDRLFGRYE